MAKENSLFTQIKGRIAKQKLKGEKTVFGKVKKPFYLGLKALLFFGKFGLDFFYDQAT